MITNIEEKKYFYNSLTERQKRHYAAIEASNLGYGGQRIISEAFNIEADTIRRGAKELKNRAYLENDRVRMPGGGRKKSRG